MAATRPQRGSSMEGKRLLRSIQLRNILSYGPESESIELEPLNVLIGSEWIGKIEPDRGHFDSQGGAGRPVRADSRRRWDRGVGLERQPRGANSRSLLAFLQYCVSWASSKHLNTPLTIGARRISSQSLNAEAVRMHTSSSNRLLCPSVPIATRYDGLESMSLVEARASHGHGWT